MQPLDRLLSYIYVPTGDCKGCCHGHPAVRGVTGGQIWYAPFAALEAGTLLHAVCAVNAVTHLMYCVTIALLLLAQLPLYGVLVLFTGYSVLNISPCPHFKSDNAGSYIGLEVPTQSIPHTSTHAPTQHTVS